MARLFLLLFLLPALSAPFSLFPNLFPIPRLRFVLSNADPSTCGCASAEQVCEVAVPESKFMGYSCSEGTFCCRQLAEPGLPDPNLLQRSVDKWVPQWIQFMLPNNWLEQLQEEPEEEPGESSRSSVNPFQKRPRVAVPVMLQHRASPHYTAQQQVLHRRPPPLWQRGAPPHLSRPRMPLTSQRRKLDVEQTLGPHPNKLQPNATKIPVTKPSQDTNTNKTFEELKQKSKISQPQQKIVPGQVSNVEQAQSRPSKKESQQEKTQRIIQELRQRQHQHHLQQTPNSPNTSKSIRKVAPRPSQGANMVSPKRKKSVQRPPESVHRPPENVQRPPQNVQRPPQSVQRPPQSVQGPPQNVQRPPQNVQRPPHHVQRSPQHVQRPPQNVRKPLQNVQRPPQNIHRPPQNVLRPHKNVQRPLQNNPESTQKIQRPQHLPQNNRRPPQNVNRPPIDTNRPPKNIHRPPNTAQKTSQDHQTPHQNPQRPPQKAQRPSQKVQRPPQKTQRPQQKAPRPPQKPLQHGQKPPQNVRKPPQHIQRPPSSHQNTQWPSQTVQKHQQTVHGHLQNVPRPPLNVPRLSQNDSRSVEQVARHPEKVLQPSSKIQQQQQLSEESTQAPTAAPSTFPPFVGSKISQLPKRQAVPRVAIVTPTPPKSEDEEEEEEEVTAPTNSSPSKALGPVYVPGVAEKYEVIMATPLEDVDPTMLGLPSGVVIKPASQVFSRRIGIATLPHSQPPVEPRVCECADINSCPADKRDYITFRKSCPFGQVQCCTDKLFLSTTFRPVSLDSTATMKTTFLNTLSQVRPVLIPIELVPRQKARAQPVQEEKGDRDEEEQPLRDDLVDQTHERGFVDQTFRKFGQWEEKTSLEAATDVPPPTTIPPPVTPYTIVSSSMTVTKLVWENGRWDPQKVDEISSKIDPYEPINIEQRQSPSYPYLGEGRAREEGFLESIGGAVFGLFGR